MKKVLSVLMGVAIALAMLAFVSAAALNNGGFELPLGDPGVAGNVRSNDGSTILSIVTDAYTGEGALKITGRTNQWGAVVIDVTSYILEKGSGEYYATSFVKGFSGSGRMTLHTHYSTGDIYRQTGVMHNFNADNWTKFGVEPSDANVPIAMKSEGDWNPLLDVTNLESANLYFWIEGNDTADLYIDDINFYKSGEQPIDWVAQAQPTATPAPTATPTIAPAATPTTAPTTAASSEVSPETDDQSNNMILIAAGVLLASAAVLVVKKRKVTQ